jgi:GNAT superfamily N-acetyltransferase
MWSEQRAKAVGPKKEEEVFLATAAVEGGEKDDDDDDDDDPTAAPRIAAASIFYARAADASTPAHVYVELMVSSTPGKGIGALLLRFVEAFALANAERLGNARQVRLLGVEAAKPFYARCGYGDANSESSSSSCKYRSKEMVKELLEQN